jgi:hypothetical protein
MNSKFLAGLASFAILASPSQAASMRFEPEGAQLDSDEILDVLLEPGKEITFSNFFDNSDDSIDLPFLGIGTVLRPTRFIEYQVAFDSKELQYIGSKLDVPGVISDSCLDIDGPCGSSIAVGDGLLTVTHRTALLNLLFPSQDFLLDTISFIGTGVNDSPGDGLSDYSLSGFNEGALSIFGFQFVGQISTFSTSTVEVQRVPGPLPLLGLGAAFGASRRLRRRLNSTQVASK